MVFMIDSDIDIARWKAAWPNRMLEVACHSWRRMANPVPSWITNAGTRAPRSEWATLHRNLFEISHPGVWHGVEQPEQIA